MHEAGQARRRRCRVAIAMAAALSWLPAAAQVTTQAPLGPVGINASPAAQRAAGVVELQGDEPLAQYLILRFMEGHPDLSWRIRGREAYARYSRTALSKVRGVGGEVQVMADAHLALIAPKQEQWDLLLLVRYPSSAAFLSMLVDPDTRPPPFSAALADSRLIGTTPS